MKKTVLKKYAKLIATVGVNVQKGQEVFITAELDQPEFVYMVVEECYRAGAKKVVVDWDYQPLTKLTYRWRTNKTLAEMAEYEEARWKHMADKLPCRIYLVSEDPDGLKGINQEKMAKAAQARYKIIKPYREQMENKYQWCIAAVPGAAWAKKLFPKLSKAQAIEKLWEAILSASRVTEDPIQAWKEHNEDLQKRCAYLNSLGIQTLEYRSSNGTDFRVGMMELGEFKGGGDTSLSGIYFNPNIPTEECFISPKKGEAEGIVYSTKPLCYNGQIIDKFFMRFEGGKVVESGAEVGAELLETLLNMDEGARYLGECALVPQTSPINMTDLLFYNTLFDENAVCHLALGRGFNDTIRDYHNKTNEECKELGINDSMIHVDFMIGCDSMNIDAVCADGKTVPIFRNGNWAF